MFTILHRFTNKSLSDIWSNIVKKPTCCFYHNVTSGINPFFGGQGMTDAQKNRSADGDSVKHQSTDGKGLGRCTLLV